MKAAAPAIFAIEEALPVDSPYHRAMFHSRCVLGERRHWVLAQCNWM